MKKILSIITAFCAVLAFAGCATTTITETTYKDDGATIASQKITETSGNPFVILAGNSASKSWTLHRGGWYANAGYSDWGFCVASLNDTISSVRDDGNSAPSVIASQAKLVSAGKYGISLSASGFSSEEEEE